MQVGTLSILAACGVFATTAMSEPMTLPEARAAGPELASVPAYVEPSNMALEFWRVWQVIDWDIDSKMIADHLKDAGWTPDAALSKKLEALQEDAIPRLLGACQGKPGDWGLDADKGIYELLPHLARLRATQRLLAADARRLMAAGKTDDAVARVVAILRMPRHLSSDRVLISSLVAQAISKAGMDEARQVVASGKAGDGAKRALVAAVADMDGADPYHVKAAIEGERTQFLGWLKKTTAGPNGHEELKKVLATVGEADADKEPAKALLAMSREDLKADLDRADGAYRDILSAWEMPDFEKQTGKIAGDIKSGKYGLAAEIFAPGLDTVTRSWHTGSEQLKAFRQEMGAK